MDGEEGASTGEPQDATQRGFLKGLNLGLLIVALCCALRAIFWPFIEVPRHVEVYKQIKVPMPGLTLLIIQFYPFVSVGLFIGAIGCCIATRAWGEQRRMVFVNGGYLLLCLGWILVSSTGLGLPMMSILEHLGGHP